MVQEIRAVFLDLNQQHRWLHPREVQNLVEALCPSFVDHSAVPVIDIPSDTFYTADMLLPRAGVQVYIFFGADHFWVGVPPSSPLKAAVSAAVLAGKVQESAKLLTEPVIRLLPVEEPAINVDNIMETAGSSVVTVPGGLRSELIPIGSEVSLWHHERLKDPARLYLAIVHSVDISNRVYCVKLRKMNKFLEVVELDLHYPPLPDAIGGKEKKVAVASSFLSTAVAASSSSSSSSSSSLASSSFAAMSAAPVAASSSSAFSASSASSADSCSSAASCSASSSSSS